MRTVIRLAASLLVLLVVASASPSGQRFSDWSTPTNLGPVPNSPFGDFFSCLSKDGLSLYFTSARSGGYGGWDIWVTERASTGDSWGPPQNLGPSINTPYDEGAPSLTTDGHVMYFASTRPNGYGNNDIYVSRRHDKRDNFGWQAAHNVGSGVNTAANEASPAIFEDDTTGEIVLYFDSNRPGGLGPLTFDAANNGNDIYIAVLQPDGTFGAAQLVTELSTPSADRQPVLSRNGLEIYFASNRPGSLGDMDLWVATRAATTLPWSAPVNLGPVVNSSGTDTSPALSFDGTELYFQSVRVGGSGAFDLFVTTRQKLTGK